ncbi:Mannan endo-1,4-beta-mannosidase 2, partial [Sesamum angolense]
YSWPIHQIDINNAFLHGFLDEDIYMILPAGCHVPEGKICLVALLVHVDDVLITSSSEEEITKVKSFLDSAFTIKDLGRAKYFLALEIARSVAGTSITQHKFIPDIISDAGLSHANSLHLTTYCDADWASYVDSRRSLTGPLYTLLLIPVFHERTKHLEIDCHLVRDKFKSGFVLPTHISGTNQLVDLFMKLLPYAAFLCFLSKLSLVSLSQSLLEGGMKRVALSNPAKATTTLLHSRAKGTRFPMFREAAVAGLTVCRTWAFSDGSNKLSLQISLRVYDENVVQALDFVVSEATKTRFA